MCVCGPPSLLIQRLCLRTGRLFYKTARQLVLGVWKTLCDHKLNFSYGVQNFVDFVIDYRFALRSTYQVCLHILTCNHVPTQLPNFSVICEYFL